MNRADLSPGSRIFAGDTGTDKIAQKQSVKLFTIGFAGVNSPVLQNAATGSFKTAQNSAELIAALEDAISKVTNSNATIASPTVPISPNRAENATDVYIPFFKPTSNSQWIGTLKKYTLGLEFLNPGICGVDAGGIVIQACLTGQTERADRDDQKHRAVRNVRVTPPALGHHQSGGGKHLVNRRRRRSAGQRRLRPSADQHPRVNAGDAQGLHALEQSDQPCVNRRRQQGDRGEHDHRRDAAWQPQQ